MVYALNLGIIGWRSGLARMLNSLFMLWGSENVIGSASAYYLNSNPVDLVTGTDESKSVVISPTVAVLNAIRASIQSPMSTDNLTFTQRVNAIDSALICTITAGNTTASDVGHTASINTSDSVTTKLTQNGTEARNISLKFSARSDSTNGILWVWGHAALTGVVTIRYIPLSAHNAGPNLVENGSKLLLASARFINSLYIGWSASAPASTMTYTLRINGVDTGISCVMLAGTTAVNNTSATASPNAADILSMKSVQSGTDTTAVNAKITIGQAGSGRAFCWDASVTSGNTSSRYLNAGANASAPTVTEAVSQIIMVTGGQFGSLYSFMSISAVTDTYTATGRINSVNTALTCQITPGNAISNDLTHTATFADADLISLAWVQTGTESLAASPRASMH